MSSDIYQINPGTYQKLTGAALPDGSLVKNMDLVNAVWVSSTAPVTPGVNATRLGPLASYNWVSKQNQNKQLYACVDTGVTIPVQLMVTDDANTLSDPVATAQAINLAGIPNVLVGDFLGNLPMQGGFISVSGYASVNIGIVVGGFPGVAEPVSVTIQFFGGAQIGQPLPQGGAMLYQKTYSCNTNKIPLAPATIQVPNLMLAIPVRGEFMLVTSSKVGGGLAAQSYMVVYGTNRALDDDVVTNSDGPCVMQLPGSTAAGSPFHPMVDFTDSTKDYFISKGGMYTIIGSSSLALQLYITQISRTGALVNIRQILFAAGATVTTQLYIPPGLISFQCNQTVAGVTNFQMDITQSL